MMKRLLTAGVAVLALAAASAARAETIRIGVLTDMAGPLSDAQGPGSVEATRMAVEDFGGRLLGEKVEVIGADHQNKADIGAAIARDWYDTRNVQVIMDLGNSAVAIAVQNIAKDKNRLSVATGAASGELTNRHCNTNAIQWGYDTYQFAKGITGPVVKSGGDRWFFISADYAFGHALENDTRKAVEKLGGKVVGAVRHPINTLDFSSYLMQAKNSGANVIGVASAIADQQNVLKQGQEFAIFDDKVRPAAMALLLSDVHSVGLKAAQGTTVSSIFYWDADDESRAFSRRYAAKMGRPPSEAQAMNYSATLAWLQAAEAAKSVEPEKVLARLRSGPVSAPFIRNGTLRADGKLVRDIWLARVKAPEQSKYPWDYMEILGTIAGRDAFRPVEESECALLKQ
ncbi:ABC transporter substrate-binding protein [Camelimonas abortus]|uniref:ABC transporter substrate-binding protein n=1 Tax=Camelimonas abortus TaxID=1017184 RepID=A0ABV7LEW3_9HYPH